VGNCVIRHVHNVGETINQPSSKCSSHRSDWCKPYCKEGKERMALLGHYIVFYGIVNKLLAGQAYTVTFIEQPSFHSLDIREDKWHQRDFEINIQNMLLHHVKILLLLFVFLDLFWRNVHHTVYYLILKSLSAVWFPTLRTQSCSHILPMLCVIHNGVFLQV